MHEFLDVIELFIVIVDSLKKRYVNLNSSLDEIVLKTSKTNLAYVDNRRDAKEKYNFDFWDKIKKQFKGRTKFINWIQAQDLNQQILYSKSEQFPDRSEERRVGKECRL